MDLRPNDAALAAGAWRVAAPIAERYGILAEDHVPPAKRTLPVSCILSLAIQAASCSCFVVLLVALAPARQETATQTSLLVSHHKTGTMLFTELRAALSATVADDQHDIDMLYGHEHDFFARLRALPPNAPLIHARRDPFELVTSGYLYHQAGSEAWCTDYAMADAADAALGRRPVYMDWHRFHLGGVAAVAAAAANGSLAHAVVGNESYAAFLTRIPLHDGLHAEALFASSPLVADNGVVVRYGGDDDDDGTTLTRMLGAQRLVDARDSATSGSFCLSAFIGSVDACDATIGECFALVTTASAEQQAQARAAAVPSACNSTSSQGHATSTATNATSKAQMVQRLRRIDADVLGLRLARAAEEVACPISSGYQ